mgnify:CR=1 FL=1|tara:strand:+ start:2308 stop:3147 length:840 start_codon:yes stop_codon:yes gene_type:complete
MIIENTIIQASKLLKKHNIESHYLDAQLILSDLMGVTKEHLILNSKENISKKMRAKYNYALKRRAKKEPVAYIIGKKEFWSEDFFVDQSTLVPRPETELIIYKVLDYFNYKKINILDIGTGSGCILLSLLKELKNSRGIGIDISAKAIKIAKKNSNRLNLSNRSQFKVFNIEHFFAGKYDVIISNPPYIPFKDIKNLSKDITNYEPFVALNGGVDGLDLIKKVIYKSNILLKKNGLLAIEIGKSQYIKVHNLLKRQGFREASKVHDYNNNVRCIISTKV